MSARHLSFVETGRSKPSRELVLHLAEHLEVPLRERNALLLAAGYAPAYTETPLDAEVMAPARAALDAVLERAPPVPGGDRRRALEPAVGQRTGARAARARTSTRRCSSPPVNAMRVSLHPDGLAPRIANLAEYGAHLLTRVQRQAVLLRRPRARRAGGRDGRPTSASRSRRPPAAEPADLLFVPLRLRSGRRRAVVLQHAGQLRHRPRHHARRARDRGVLPGRRRHPGGTPRPLRLTGQTLSARG